MQAIHPVLFWIVASVTALCAIATVVTHNIVRAATWLLFTLAGTSAIFFLLGADFVGAVQLLVYVGGTLILVIFGVMLTAQGPFISMKTSGAEWAISVLAGGLLLAMLAVGIYQLQQPVIAQTEVPNATLSRESATLGQAFLGVGLGPEHQDADGPVRMHYLLPFELVSVHLLVVLIGAAYLARAKRRQQGATP